MSRLPVFLSTGQAPGAPPCCPVCQTPSDAWTRLGDRPGGGPKPGNAAVCVYCSAVAIYGLGTRGLILRGPTEAERAAFEQDGLCQLARSYTEDLRRSRQQ